MGNTEQGTEQDTPMIVHGDSALDLLHMAKADFIVLAMPRSGSAWLTNLLNTHPYILANHCPSWNTTDIVTGFHASTNSAVQDCAEKGLPKYSGLYGIVTTISWSPAHLNYLRNTTKPVIILNNTVEETVESCIACETRRGGSVTRQEIENSVVAMVEDTLRLYKHRKEHGLPYKLLHKKDLLEGDKPTTTVDLLKYVLEVFHEHPAYKNLLPLTAPTFYKALQAHDFNITNKLY